ncbi:YxlC family protein [Paenibacillus sp. S150]|uniref:YxlC family protein n=1 Tax=Paenibacillus sp. S150 TaxID=2749826 RepID=UPI001C562AB3|nr:YxlC family protein [Paenibacillus sp. S150]MBW4083781.1 YxlC family protein [Paenibacillus sp. S150]
MKKEKDEELLRMLSADLERLDAQYGDVTPPSLPQLERLIAGEAIRRQHQRRREFLWFLLVALFMVSVVLLGLGFAPVTYWILQAAFPIAALGCLAVMRLRLRREDA